jgi:3-methyladenine DNA glycosylase AlkD
MARYNIPTAHALGVPMREVQSYARRVGRDQDLANGLWITGLLEARMLAAFVAEPARLTPTLMDRWVKDFDNWAVCDTLCFVLFDRTPHAWGRVDAWAARRAEFVKRAAFALLWALALHDKTAADARFTRGLALIEREAHDERHLVEKAIDMALRAIGKRSATLHAAASEVAGRLASSSSRAAARIGRHAMKALARRRPKR